MFPTQNNIRIPLQGVIARRGGAIVFSRDGDEIEDELAEFFGLSDAERNRTHAAFSKMKDGRKWRHDIQRARHKCVSVGWIAAGPKDVWELTASGWFQVQWHYPSLYESWLTQKA